MKMNRCIRENTVNAEHQVSENCKAYLADEDSFRVLFLGNSFTLHEAAPEIGWHKNCGMAASCAEKDFVHIVLAALKEKFGNVNYCITNVSSWERNYFQSEILEAYTEAKNFQPNLTVICLGANVNREALALHNFGESFLRFVQFFQNPHNELIITNNFWEFGEVDQELKKVSELVGADFVDISDLGYNESNMALGEYEHKGVAMHPNDRGMRLIAERIIEKII